MRTLIQSELNKIHARKGILLFFVTAIVVNLFLCIQTANTAANEFFSTPKGYKSLYEQLPPDDFSAKSFLEGKLQELPEDMLVSGLLDRRILREIDERLNYQSYLSGIFKNAEKSEQSGLFSDAFSSKNIKKTAQDFKTMTAVTPLFGPSLGVTNAASGLYTDILAISFIFLSVLTLFTYERENGLVLLTRATQKGGRSHVTAKLIACCIITIAAFVLLYLPKILVSGVLFGLGDLSRPLQSVYGASFGVLKITVGQYFIAYCGMKLFSLLAISALLSFVAIPCKRRIYAYCAMASSLFVCGVFWWVQTERFLTNYANVNLFGNAVNQTPLWIICIISGGLLCSFFAQFIYHKQSITEVSKLTFSGFSSGGAITGEFYKFLFENRAALVLFATVVISVSVNIFAPVSEQFPDGLDSMYYKRIAVLYEGKLTAEKEAAIWEEASRFDGTSGQLYTKLSEHLSYLKETPDALLFYDEGLKRLTFSDISSDLWLFLIAVVALSACFLGLLSLEHKNRTILLIKATAKGERLVKRAKLTVMAVTVILMFSVLYGSYFFGVFSAYGLYGLEAPAMSMEHLSFMPSWINGMCAVALCALLRYIALCGIAGTAMWLGQKRG